jgi:hypothetical protein
MVRGEVMIGEVMIYFCDRDLEEEVARSRDDDLCGVQKTRKSFYSLCMMFASKTGGKTRFEFLSWWMLKQSRKFNLYLKDDATWGNLWSLGFRATLRGKAGASQTTSSFTQE